MLQIERTNDIETSLRVILRGFQSELWTALPGIVDSYDPDTQTCSVQPAIKINLLQQDGSVNVVQMPLCLDVPVQFPGAGGFVFTFPVVAGDECLLVFANRCIDSWFQSGGVQTQAEFRMHDLSDGFAFMGFRSKPNVVENISTDSAQLRSLDGESYAEVKDGVVTLRVAAGDYTEVNVNGVTKMRASDHLDLNGVIIDTGGNVSGVGTLDATGEGTFDGHTVGAHVHGGVTAGGSNTGTPSG